MQSPIEQQNSQFNQSFDDWNNADPCGQHIVVAEAGFVYVGTLQWNAGWARITNAKNIRKFGTTNGLGQLRTGPTSETIIDECGTVFVSRKSVIHVIPCTGF